MRTVNRPNVIEFELEGFVTMEQWSRTAPAIKARVGEDPAMVVALRCGRVTGFAPAAYVALAVLVQAIPGRVLLRNWPEALSRASGPQLLVAQILDELVSTLQSRVAELGPESRAFLDVSMAQLVELHAQVKRNCPDPGLAPGSS